ncbi:hypothetical protein [Parafrankia sp. FMc2]|uniref:hypothetical protein n=1 Tax=Parafrankia sp. FMc2 TaxID=3233196 RepID=UPI0034D5A64F
MVTGRNGGTDPGKESVTPAQRQWFARPAELDQTFADVRKHVGDQLGEIEIIWRPAR